MKIRLKTTTAIYCPFCKSPFVSHEKPDVVVDTYHKETYMVKCVKCGAIGMVGEVWDIPDSVKEV